MRDERQEGRDDGGYRDYPRKTGNVIGSFGYDIRHLKRRVERIERRLGILDTDVPGGQTRGDDRGGDTR